MKTEVEGMWPFSKRKENKENTYTGLRKQALEIKVTPNIEQAMAGHPVYAAVVDMDMKNAVVTLVCVVDGSTSLYFSNGGGQLGLGQASADIYKATVAFLHSAEQVIDKLPMATDYSLPTRGLHRVYLLTKDGAYFQEYDMKVVNEMPKEQQFLNFLYQNVLSAIGKNQQAEQG